MRKFSVLGTIFTLLIAIALSPMAAFAQDDEMAEMNIVEIASSDEQFSTLVAAVDAAGLVDTLAGEGPFTVFAPTNAAFDRAFAELGITAEDLLADTETLTNILLYHVVPGSVMAADVVELESAATAQGNEIMIEANEEGVVLNGGAEVTVTDIEASNGVIHVINAVILPPAEDEEEGSFAGAPQSIAETVMGNEDFSTLLAAVEAAGLSETLAGEGPFTVFAPTDDAFAAAFEALGIAPEDLLADTETLTNILLYHVAEGEVMAADVVEMDSFMTLQGSDVMVSVTDEGVFLNDDIQVIATDVEASNGVIHIIDGVLLPPSE